MKKIIFTLVALSLSTPAGAATVTIDLTRWNVIGEAAKSICRDAINLPGSATAIMNRESEYLNLSIDEQLLMSSLCLLYVRGRNDGGQ